MDKVLAKSDKNHENMLPQKSLIGVFQEGWPTSCDPGDVNSEVSVFPLLQVAGAK